VQDFISKRVDGICLAPTDSQALLAVVQQARDEGIPVVIYDSGLSDDTNAISTVATDNNKAGVIAAQRMGKVLEGKGNVVVLRYTPGSQSTELRERGFLETLAKESPGIKVISENEYAGDTAETALDKAQKLLEQFNDQVQGVFTPCEHVTAGMLQALTDAELTGKIKFVGFDASPRLVQALKEGKIHGLVLQDPVSMASTAVEKLVDHLSGKAIEKRISSGEWLATPENFDEPDIQKLLDPERVE
jgi:ribose transport system substrate-binding protein